MLLVVSEPDPQNIEKERLVNRAGWKCTLQNVRNLLIAEPSVAFLLNQTLAKVF